MRYTTAVLCVITLFIFTSCNNTNQILLQDESEFSGDKSVSVMLIEADHLFDYFPNHTFGALRSTERAIFDNQLLQLLSENTQSPVLGIKSSSKLDPDLFETRTLDTDNSTITTLTPKQGTDLNSSENSSRYTLILDRFHFISYQATSGAGSYAGHEQETQNRIKFDLIYVIWDNELQREIGWGQVDADQLIYGDDISTSYRNAISSAFEKIINVSPFQPV